MIHDAGPIETAELIAFARIIEAKSLSRAADELAVPRATIGRRLARLESRLGVRLLRRTTRSLALTEAGERFFRHARLVLDALDQAASSVRVVDGAMRGTIRVSAPAAMEDSFIAFLAGFAHAQPDIRLTVDFSNRVVDLVREGYDVALRAVASALQPGLVARQIARQEMIAVASPAYLAAHGAPRTLGDLRKHRCLTTFARGELPQAAWPSRRRAVQVESVLSSNEPRLIREAAIRGVGIAQIPRFYIDELVARGALVQVLRGQLEAALSIAVVFVDREFLPPHVRLFIEQLVTWASDALGARPSQRPHRASRTR